MYCKKCGGKVESYASHCPFCGEAMGGNDVTATYTKASAEGEAAGRSIGKWILTYILVGIPLVGFILMLIWAFGDKTKADPTFRNWARANLILAIIAVVATILIALLGGSLLAGLMMGSGEFPME